MTAVHRATSRLLAIWPAHEHVAPGTVRYADLVTSTCDARAALTLAVGRVPDVDGYPLEVVEGAPGSARRSTVSERLDHADNRVSQSFPDPGGGEMPTHPRTDHPRRIQRRRTRGWRMSDGAKYVGRGSRWGNPYRALGGTVFGPAGGPLQDGELVAYSMHAPAERAVVEAVEAYRRDIGCATRSQLTTELIRRELAGRDLACWYALDQPCHADVLLQLANEEPS